MKTLNARDVICGYFVSATHRHGDTQEGTVGHAYG
jgi:hypothetical protein